MRDSKFIVTPDERCYYIDAAGENDEIELLKYYDRENDKRITLYREKPSSGNVSFGKLCYYHGKVYMLIRREYSGRRDKYFLLSVDQWNSVEKKEIKDFPDGRLRAYGGAYYSTHYDTLYKLDLETACVTSKKTDKRFGDYFRFIKNGWGYCGGERFRIDDPSVREKLPNVQGPGIECHYDNDEALVLPAEDGLVFGAGTRRSDKIFFSRERNGVFEKPERIMPVEGDYIYDYAFVCGNCLHVYNNSADPNFRTVNLDIKEARADEIDSPANFLIMPDGRTYLKYFDKIVRIGPDMWNNPKPVTVADCK